MDPGRPPPNELKRGRQSAASGHDSGTPEVLQQFIGGQRAGEVVALHHLDAEILDKGQLLLGFNPFGNQRQRERTSQLDNGSNDLLITLLQVDIGDEAAIDFQNIQRETAQIAEIGVASTEVIDADLDPRVRNCSKQRRTGVAPSITTPSVSSSSSREAG